MVLGCCIGFFCFWFFGVCVGGCILPAYMSVYLVHAVPTEARKGVKSLKLELMGKSSKPKVGGILRQGLNFKLASNFLVVAKDNPK